MEDEINDEWEWTSEGRHLYFVVVVGMTCLVDVMLMLLLLEDLLSLNTNQCVCVCQYTTQHHLMFDVLIDQPKLPTNPKNANSSSSWWWDSVVVVRSRSTIPKEPTKVFELTHSHERDGSSSLRKTSDFNNASWSWCLLLVAALWEISSSHCVPRDTQRDPQWEETEGRE